MQGCVGGLFFCSPGPRFGVGRLVVVHFINFPVGLSNMILDLLLPFRSIGREQVLQDGSKALNNNRSEGEVPFIKDTSLYYLGLKGLKVKFHTVLHQTECFFVV